MASKENFDTVKWIREVRDKNFSKHKKLTLKEFAFELSKEAKKSKLWEKINKDRKITH